MWSWRGSGSSNEYRRLEVCPGSHDDLIDGFFISAESPEEGTPVAALEHLLHRVFSDVRLSLNQVGKDSRVYEPSEWYVVPLPIIDRAIELITSGDIVDHECDAISQALRVRR